MEGYVEIEIQNPFWVDSIENIIVKSCNKCQYNKTKIHKSISKQIQVCNLIEENDNHGFKFNTRLYKNTFGYYEPPGIDGEECPFHKQLLREKSINKLLQ